MGFIVQLAFFLDKHPGWSTWKGRRADIPLGICLSFSVFLLCGPRNTGRSLHIYKLFVSPFPRSDDTFWCLVALLPLGSEFVINRAEMPSPRHCAAKELLIGNQCGNRASCTRKKRQRGLWKGTFLVLILTEGAVLITCARDLVPWPLATVTAQVMDLLGTPTSLGCISAQVPSTGIWTWSFLPLLAKQIVRWFHLLLASPLLLINNKFNNNNNNILSLDCFNTSVLYFTWAQVMRWSLIISGKERRRRVNRRVNRRVKVHSVHGHASSHSIWEKCCKLCMIEKVSLQCICGLGFC